MLWGQSAQELLRHLWVVAQQPHCKSPALQPPLLFPLVHLDLLEFPLVSGQLSSLNEVNCPIPCKLRWPSL